jgi:hypothetical protein
MRSSRFQVLRRTHGAFELLDVSASLLALKRIPGLTSWLVQDKDQVWYDSWEEGQKVGVGVQGMEWGRGRRWGRVWRGRGQ